MLPNYFTTESTKDTVATGMPPTCLTQNAKVDVDNRASRVDDRGICLP